jgi:hypothetical protein
MQVSVYSRFMGARLVTGTNNRRYVSDREPYRYQAQPDNIEHVVTHADTLASLAGRYFAPLPRACGFWWAIADYQPTPIINPLRPLYQHADVIVVPSLRVLHDFILRARS